MSLDQIWIPNIIYLLEALCDSLTMQAMNRILGAALYDSQWQQAQPPVNMGGLGRSSARLSQNCMYNLHFPPIQELWIVDRFLGMSEECGKRSGHY